MRCGDQVRGSRSMGLRGVLTLAVLALGSVPPGVATAAGETDAASFDDHAVQRVQQPPLGLPSVPVPAANPVTPAKVSLGRDLFFDRRLSRNRTMSCAMCHLPEQGYTSNEMATPIGVKGASLLRNAPTLYNVAYLPRLFLDLREESLEQQVLGPLFSPDEMANPSVAFLLETVRAAPEYAGRFEAVFGRPVDLPAVGEVLAAYERTLVSGDSPFDRWHFGKDERAVPEPAKRGYAIFTGKAGCVACHAVAGDHALFTDNAVHNTGVGTAAPKPVRIEVAPGVEAAAVVPAGPARPPSSARDLGRKGITDDPKDLHAFRTPGLRNVALTAPYMHDGSLATLSDVVRFYAAGGEPNQNLDPRMQPLALSEGDVADLVAFLESLNGANVAELTRDARSTVMRN